MKNPDGIDGVIAALSRKQRSVIYGLTSGGRSKLEALSILIRIAMGDDRVDEWIVENVRGKWQTELAELNLP